MWIVRFAPLINVPVPARLVVTVNVPLFVTVVAVAVRVPIVTAPEIETFYVMSSPQYSFISSSGVKEIASFGGKVDELVPEAVARRFREMFPNGRPGAPLSPQE